MLTQAAFNAFCAGLPATTHVVQWEGADVWKVGGKMFAIGAWGWGQHAGITFKVTPLAFEVMKDAPGLRPAPYLASRGMTWLQAHGDEGQGEESILRFIADSHHIVAAGLSRKLRVSLGLA